MIQKSSHFQIPVYTLGVQKDPYDRYVSRTIYKLQYYRVKSIYFTTYL